MSYNIYQLAVLMHRNYEKASKKYNWNTQKGCKVEFDGLPEANKKVMLDVAEFVFNEIQDERKQGAVEVLDKIKRKLFEEENLYKNLYFKRKDICEIVNKELEGVEK